jgi:hypothetical protein
MIARFIATPDGAIVYMTAYGPAESPPAPEINEFDIDAPANPDILAAWDTDSRSFALVDGMLLRNGEPVAINPPAPPEPTQAERVAAALISLPELSASSKALLIDALGSG